MWVLRSFLRTTKQFHRKHVNYRNIFPSKMYSYVHLEVPQKETAARPSLTKYICSNYERNLSAFKRNSLKGEETITLYFFQLHRKYITPRKYAKNSPLYMQKFVVCQEHLKRLLVDFPQPLKMNLTAISCTFDNISDHNIFNTTH